MLRRLSCFAFVIALPIMSCNGNSVGGDNDPPGSTDDGGSSSCVNRQCQIVNCEAKGKSATTLSGIVNIPSGNLPLYNATVYVPNSTVAPLTSGASCDRCTDLNSGDPVVTTTTDVNGHFSLKNVPVGSSIPLVIRLGKWRRQITINTVSECTDNPVDPTLTRLPRNQSEGEIPKIALATGGYDATECLLRKIGIDDSEFTPESGTGRINLYAAQGGTNAYCKAGTGKCTKTLNNGAAFTVASDTMTTPGWWSDFDKMKPYDMVILSCEGGLYAAQKSTAAHQAMLKYLNMGGRVFASHWNNIWISGDPTLSAIGSFVAVPGTEYNSPITASIYQTTTKGIALADWMVNVGGSTTRGQLTINKARDSTMTVDKTKIERFVSFTDPARANKVAEQYFSFYTPLNTTPENQCGRMVFTDMHASGNDADAGKTDPTLDLSSAALPFPSGCITTALSAQEKALLFLIFDLSNCVQPVIG